MINPHATRTSATVSHKHKYISNLTITPVETVIPTVNNLATALEGKMLHYLQESPLAKLTCPSKIFSDAVAVPEHNVAPHSPSAPERETTVEPELQHSLRLITHVNQDGQLTAPLAPVPGAPTGPPIPQLRYIWKALEILPRCRKQIHNYVGNIFVQNVSGLRKCVATQDMSDMLHSCHMTFFNVARHLRKSMLINVATMSSKRHVFEMSS